MYNSDNNEKISIDDILYLSFNLDSTCFNVGHKDGFIIYNTDPFRFRFKVSGIGEIKIAEVLDKSNLVAIVGAYGNKYYSPTKLSIWDDFEKSNIGFQCFDEEILKVKITVEKIFVLTLSKIHVLEMKTFQEIEQHSIHEHQHIFTISNNLNNIILAWPSAKMGSVNIKSYTSEKLYCIDCHRHDIQCISFNNDAKMMATASHTGTNIRIFDTSNGKLIRELRRGSTPTIIQSLIFNKDSNYLCVSTDKGTIHIFDLKYNDNNNQVSALSFISSIIPINYFKSEWSCTQIYVNNGIYIATISEIENSVIVLTMNGNYCKYGFTPKKKAVELKENTKWL
jgi:WD40 repeat protein